MLVQIFFPHYFSLMEYMKSKNDSIIRVKARKMKAVVKSLCLIEPRLT